MKNQIYGFFYGIFVAIFIAVIVYFTFGYFSSFVGWYGYEKWKYRIKTDKINNSKERKVFIKELNYRIIDSNNLKGFYFKPYIERAFRYGYHSKNEIRIDEFTKFPYNLCYEYGLKDSVAIYIKEEDKKKLDSIDEVWGYLSTPYLKDTINFEINSKNHSGIIKVW